MKVFYLFFIVLCFINYSNLHAQVDDVACQPPSKKVQKIIEKAKNAKETRETIDGFIEAIKLEPENALAYYEYGLYAFNKSSEYYQRKPIPAMEAGDQSLQKAEEMFLTVVEKCNTFHADVYYYLGVINYTQQEFETSNEWFERFVQFKSTDPSRYSEDHAKKIADVKEVVQEYQQQQEIQQNKVPYEPKLIPNVSTSLNEYFPMISPDNELMFFTRKVNDKALGEMKSNWVEKFTVSKRKRMNLPFDGGSYLKPPFNNGDFDNYGASTLSVDNKEMILCACKTEIVYNQPYKNCDLYITTYKRTGEGGNDFQWTELENMGSAINTKDGWEGQPSLSADGNTLYFTTTRLGSQDNDIYYSTRDENGIWLQAKPLAFLNTKGKDKSPFIHQDSETLYFVSNGREDGVGGLDIYYTRKDANGNWQEPKNIGYPINSEQDEIGIFVSIDGKIAYFCSRQKGDWNIYGFELYEEARPQSVAIIKGDLSPNSFDPIEDAVIEIAYENSYEITRVKVNGNDGKYAAIIKTDKAQDVMISVKKEGYAFDSKLIDKKVLQESSSSDDVAIRGKDMEVKELKVGEAYTINDILYSTNSSELSAKSKFILKEFARFLKNNPSIEVSIQGHTDDVGDDNNNLQLSENRAKGVMNYLVSIGVDLKRLSAIGYGETKPKVPNTTAINRAKNRRTDFVILKL